MNSTASFSAVRLALINSLGFSATTVIPLWVADISADLDSPTWYGGVVASAQVTACAVANVLTSFCLRNVSPRAIIRLSMLLAAAANLTASIANARVFLIACLIVGSSLGAALSATNRMAASFESVQRAYSVFQLTEVCFAAGLFFIFGAAAQHIGVQTAFVIVAVANAAGAVIVGGRKVERYKFEAIGLRVLGAHWVTGTLLLSAIMFFFMGQSSVNSFMVPIGRLMGLATDTISRILSCGILSALVGAFIARILGESRGLYFPIAVSIVILSVVLPVMTLSSARWAFVAVAFLLPLLTIFVVPYFFTALANLGGEGLYSSIGPAALLLGVAAGPAIGVFSQTLFGLNAVGLASAAALVISGLMLCLAFLREKAKP